jgi:PAS domain S-box-containing protein
LHIKRKNSKIIHEEKMEKQIMKSILLVEDEALISLAESNVLRNIGYHVIPVNSGEKAVQAALENPEINLVLMDINLGRGIDGPEAAQQILSAKNIPIIFLTSHTEEDMVDKVRGITHYGYLIKNSGDFVLKNSIEMAFELFESNTFLTIQHELSLFLNSGSDLKQCLEKVLKTVIQFESIDSGGIYLTDHATGDLDLIVHYGLSPDFIKEVSHFTRDMPNVRLVEAGRALYGNYDDIRPLNDKTRLTEGLRAYAIIPVSCQGHLIAVINLTSHSYDFIPEKTRLSLETLALHIGGTLMRIRTEDALRESEEKYRNIVEQSMLGIGISKGDKITFANPALLTIFNYNDYEEFLGMHLMDLVAPSSKQKIKERIKILEEGNEPPPEFEYEILCKGGLTKCLLAHSTYLSLGGESYTQTTFQDITSRKNAEMALKESETRFKNFVEKAPIPIASVNLDGTVEFINRKGIDAFGYHHEDIITLSNWWPKAYPDMENPGQHAAAWLESARKAMDQGTDIPGGERSLTCMDGSVKTVFTYGVPISGRIFVIFEDITERKQAEQKITALLAEKELILKEVHHRIKNNMTTIFSLLNLQAGTLKDPLSVAALKDAGSRIKSMIVLYDKLYQLSDFSSVSISGYISSLIDEIIKNFPNSNIVTMEKIIEDFDLDLKRLQIIGIIINELLTNIMKYAFTGRKEGKIKISVSLKSPVITIIIEDNGCGMPESVDFMNTTGFGLKLVNLLIGQLNGHIHIERIDGTRIIIEFDQ